MKTKKSKHTGGCPVQLSSTTNDGICLKLDSEICICFQKGSIKLITWKRVDDPKTSHKGIFVVFHTRKQHDRLGCFIQTETECEVMCVVGLLQMLDVKIKEIKVSIVDAKVHRCMCCGKTVEHINAYESPPPHAKHLAEWRDIKKIEICDTCRDLWNKKMMSSKKDPDIAITSGNKWLFDRICKNMKAK